jgi:hypothetical protein
MYWEQNEPQLQVPVEVCRIRGKAVYYLTKKNVHVTFAPLCLIWSGVHSWLGLKCNDRMNKIDNDRLG